MTRRGLLLLAFAFVMFRCERLLAPDSWLDAAWPPVAWADDDDDDDGDDDGGDDDGGDDDGDENDDDNGSDGGGDDDDDDDRDDGDDDSRDDDDDASNRNGRNDGSRDRGRGRGRGRETLFDWWDRVVTGAATTGSSGRETVADEILVVDISAASLQQALGQGFTLLERRQLGTLALEVTRLGLPPGLSPDAAVSRFQAMAPAGTVDVNHAYELQAESCSGDYCWGAQLIGWGPGTRRCGSGQRIGVIDTAVDASQPALRGSLISSRSFVERSASSGHGTAVAAILVGNGGGLFGGLLPGAELMAADVFTRDGQGRPRAGALQIATALDWLAAERVGVINVSIAGPPNVVLERAIGRVVVRGIPIVAAAGNNGAEAAPAYPAAYPGVLAATAVDRDMAAYAKANRGDYIAFAAPGVDVWTVSGDEAVRGSGTSYAAAFLTGVVAQHLTDGGTTAARLAATLSRRAKDLGIPGKDPVFGWGLVRAAQSCRG